jgi:uncharacterized membrane protein
MESATCQSRALAVECGLPGQARCYLTADMGRLLDLILKFDARHRIVLGLVAGIIVFCWLRGRVPITTALISSWDTLTFVVLALAWIVIFLTPPTKIRAHAQAQDVSHLLIFVFVVLAASVALFSVGFLLGPNRTGRQPHLTAHVVLTLGTVIFSWMLVHTVFGLHYAHVFYGDSDQSGQDRHAAGLDFPGGHPPNYFDFAYFSFVIGMTCQVSDVQITSRRLRRVTLLHSALSFAFNTVILALLINTVSGLL